MPMVYSDKTVSHLIAHFWLTEARCGCGHVGRLAGDDLAKLPPSALVADVVARLRCEACGSGDVSAIVLNDTAGRAAQDVAAFEAKTTTQAAARRSPRR